MPWDWTVVGLTARLAAVTTLVLLALGTPIGWWLARTRRPARPLVEALVALPLVLPPTVLGFYLLVALGPRGPIGAGPLDRFRTVVLPLSRPGFLTAATLGFAHTVGEFGVVLMIGGNIPGRTEVLSVALFNRVEALRYGEAHTIALSLLLFSFVVLLLVYTLNRRFETPRL